MTTVHLPNIGLPGLICCPAGAFHFLLWILADPRSSTQIPVREFLGEFRYEIYPWEPHSKKWLPAFHCWCCQVQKLNEELRSELLKCMNLNRSRLLRWIATERRQLGFVLRKSKLLRGTKFKDLRIDQDRTPKQEKEHKTLLAEVKTRCNMNEDVVIRRSRHVFRNNHIFACDITGCTIVSNHHAF